MAYQLNFTEKADEDIAFHKKAGNKVMLKKITNAFRRTGRASFYGNWKA
jgi:Txe/YoeB family toxin of Txe-Axe toxin-antitoxin module